MFWKTILSFFSGPISSVSNDLKEAYQAKLNASTNEEKIASEERIAFLEARKTVILAAQGDPWERFIRIALAVPFILYINKLIIWDKILSWGVTDDLSSDLKYIMFGILAGYYIDIASKRITRK